MSKKSVAILVLGTIAGLFAAPPMAQDRFTLKSPNGIELSEFRGYESWQAIAPSQPNGLLKIIVGNEVAISAYKEGVPGNGKPFPDGSKLVKIAWSTKKSATAPDPTLIADTLKSVGFMEKDSKRFPDTDGWGYAQFAYDAPSDTFKSYDGDISFGKKECHQCHTIVAADDFVFTKYAKR